MGWIVEAEVRGCFESLAHGRLRALIRRRGKAGRILRLIGKWRNAGVVDGDALSSPDHGTPQGGTLTPPTKLQTFFSGSDSSGWGSTRKTILT